MALFRLNKLEIKEIGEVLNRFGLNKNECEVYLALLGLGKVTITPLARRTGIPVTTIQSVLKRLTDRGLLEVTVRRSRHVYEALDPLVLRCILERDMEQVANIIPLLKKMYFEDEISPKIRIFTKDRINDIFRESLECKSKLVYEIVSAKEFQEVIGERLHYTKLRLKNNVKLKSLRVESNEIKKYSRESHVRELREAKFLPKDLNFRCNITFWDNTVAFVLPKEEGLAWTVESRALVETFCQIFDLLWSVSRRMEVKDASQNHAK